MTRYKMTLMYDGHLFHGFQRQPHDRTVQGEIERALAKMTKGKRVVVEGSGRTDAGVHAIGQVIHFDFPGKSLPAEKMLLALNSMMPMDILFTDSRIVTTDFHARFGVTGKWYRYRVDCARFVNPFKRFYTGHYPYPVNVGRMNKAARDLLGTHDFTSFAASGGQIRNKVRTMYFASVKRDAQRGELVFDFISSGFLYNMVRILVSSLLEVGRGMRPVHDLRRVIALRDRQQVRQTAMPNGLYLYHVFYGDIPLKYRMDLDCH